MVITCTNMTARLEEMECTCEIPYGVVDHFTVKRDRNYNNLTRYIGFIQLKVVHSILVIFHYVHRQQKLQGTSAVL